jgi:hypothetical protein
MTIQAILASTYYSTGGGGGIDPNAYPVMGSGEYNTTAGNAGAVTNPVDPGGATETYNNAVGGWAYYIKDGQFNNDTTFFDGVSVAGVDTYGGFGFQFLSKDFYAIQWVGYIYIPTTGNYRISLTADDLLYFWIGTNALPGNFNFSNVHHSVNNNTQFGPDLALTGSRWYPVRMWFQEWSGAERAQVFLGAENSTMLSMSSYQLAHDFSTGGHSV